MGHLPTTLRKKLSRIPFYRTCAREGVHGHTCDGRITWEHAIIVAGTQVQAEFAIVPLCEKAHAVGTHQDGGDLDKEVNLWICLNRASESEILSISKAIDYFWQRARLNEKYGVYVPTRSPEFAGIDYGRQRDIISPLAS